MKPIYKPKGAAAEYADYALNIYTGCTNGCDYCYAPGVLRKTRDAFANDVCVRPGLYKALYKQLKGGAYEGETVHLCFTCDPYPIGVDTEPTRDVIKMLKSGGCHVQILTKNPVISTNDWDLLDEDDWVGTTVTGAENRELNAEPEEFRLFTLYLAKNKGFNTWLSMEPVLDPERAIEIIETCDFIDLFKIGKLNHVKSDIDWSEFGHRAERACQELGRNYVIKESLRKEMTESKVENGTCKICGGPTYSVDGVSFICKVMGCPAWYLPQGMFVKVRTEDGQEGYMLEHRVPEGVEIIE